jgi:hypothetical protein
LGPPRQGRGNGAKFKSGCGAQLRDASTNVTALDAANRQYAE